MTGITGITSLNVRQILPFRQANCFELVHINHIYIHICLYIYVCVWGVSILYTSHTHLYLIYR